MLRFRIRSIVIQKTGLH